MTCLTNSPPVIDILEWSKSTTGSMNFIHTEMLCSLVLMWYRLVKFTSGPREGGVLNLISGIRESEVVINITVGLKESEGHNYIYQEETPNKYTFKYKAFLIAYIISSSFFSFFSFFFDTPKAFHKQMIYFLLVTLVNYCQSYQIGK